MNTKKDTTTPVQYVKTMPDSPLRFVWFFSMRQKKWAILATIAVIVASSLVTVTNLVYKFVVDTIIAENYSAVLYLVLAYPALVYSETLFWRLSGYMGMVWSTKLAYDVYNNLVAYTMNHSHTYFIDRFAGSLLSKVDNVVDSSHQLVHDYLWSHLETFVILFTSFVLVFSVDEVAGLLFFLLLTTLVIVNKNLTPRQTRLSRTNAEALTTLRGHIVDTFTNISAVRHHATQSHEEKRLARLADDSRKAHLWSWFYSETTMTINMTVLFAFSVLIFYILATRWQAGAITAGDLILVIAIFATVSGSLTRMGRAFNDTGKAYGKMSEGLDELIREFEIRDTSRAKKLKAGGGEVVWKGVTFEFGANRVFDSFNLTIKPGERIGLVGSSGAGKTTFVSLLLRQHDLTSGAITIDSQDISKITQDSLRQNIAVVPQEPLLFHRTIKENIAYGKPGATQKEIEEVAKKAHAHDFIQALPEKYDTMVGERGIKLSGGQKQRIAIARAMLKEAPLLVLDEATSALDSESEVLIQKALHELMENKTVVAIAHRLSTLRKMDRIIVLEQGEIIEDGPHDVLASSGGTYARLWEHQAGGFLQE